MNLSKNTHKLSNLFIVGFEGTILTEELKGKLLKLTPAGIILFNTNIESREQVKKLTLDLKNLLGEKLLISVDQEGGKVERLRKISPSLCSLYTLGKASSELNKDGSLSEKSIDNLRTHTRLLALDLIDLGFNLVFAPCADLNSNRLNPIIGTRSLGEDTNLISKQLNVIISELKKYPLLHCVKHFPGHGDAKIDSHLALPEIDLSDIEKYEMHLKPFKEAIKLETDSVMVAHAVFSLPSQILKNHESLTNLPASINPSLIKEFLIDKLNFKNLVISDEITMKALSDFGDYESISRQMIKAGNDLIIWNTNIDEALEICEAELSEGEASSIRSSLNKINGFYDLLERRKEKYSVAENFDLEINSLYKKQISFLKRIYQSSELKGFIEEIKNKVDLIFCFDHHKIENFVLEKIFPNTKIIRFTEKTKLEQDLTRFSNQRILVFSFLAFTNNKQREQINLIKNSQNQVIEIACDFLDTQADVNLFGFNLVHLESLLQYQY